MSSVVFNLSFCMSIRLSVRCMLCDKTNESSANILKLYEKIHASSLWHWRWFVDSRDQFSSVCIFVYGAEIAKKSQRRRTVAYDTAATSTGLLLEQMSLQLTLECVKAKSWWSKCSRQPVPCSRTMYCEAALASGSPGPRYHKRSRHCRPPLTTTISGCSRDTEIGQVTRRFTV